MPPRFVLMGREALDLSTDRYSYDSLLEGKFFFFPNLCSKVAVITMRSRF